MSKPRTVCADCGHHKSAHQYLPGQPANEGPKTCRLCDCSCYRQPAKYERITKRPVTKR